MTSQVLNHDPKWVQMTILELLLLLVARLDVEMLMMIEETRKRKED